MASSNLSPIKNWLSDEELTKIYSSIYWNDIETEKKKEWWIADGNYGECLRYLDESGLMEEYRIAENYIKEHAKSHHLKVADLAAGIGWTTSLLSKLDVVESVHAVEISRHRLTTLFDHCVGMLAANPTKIFRYIGSFYDLKFADSSMDVVFLSQAFHHAKYPLKLLIEIDRVLRGG